MLHAFYRPGIVLVTLHVSTQQILKIILYYVLLLFYTIYSLMVIIMSATIICITTNTGLRRAAVLHNSVDPWN